MKEGSDNSPSKTELGDSLSERVAGLSPALKPMAGAYRCHSSSLTSPFRRTGLRY
jgi:hypothetical protein